LPSGSARAESVIVARPGSGGGMGAGADGAGADGADTDGGGSEGAGSEGSVRKDEEDVEVEGERVVLSS